MLFNLPQQEHETHTLNKHMTGCLLESYVPAVDLGTYLRKDIGCWAAFTISDAMTHTLLRTHRGRGGFPRGMLSLHVSSSSLVPLQRKRRSRWVQTSWEGRQCSLGVDGIGFVDRHTQIQVLITAAEQCGQVSYLTTEKMVTKLSWVYWRIN